MPTGWSSDGISKIGQWVGRSDGQLPPVVEPVADPPQWIAVAKAASALADAVSGTPVAGKAVALLTAIADAQDTQTAMLKAIARDVQLMREGPYKTAQKHLDIAHQNGPADSEYARELAAAHSELVRAYGQASSEQERSVICYHLALVALLRGKPAEAEAHLRESYKYCQSVVNRIAPTANRKSELEIFGKIFEGGEATQAASKAGIAAIGAAALGGALLAGALIPVATGVIVAAGAGKRREVRRNKATTILEGYAPFVNAVVLTLNTVAGNEHQPGLASRCDDTTRYQFEWRVLNS